MTKKQVPQDLDHSIGKTKNKAPAKKVVRMNFEISEDLRNAFKAKAAKHGKKVKDILATFMIEYIENDKK